MKIGIVSTAYLLKYGTKRGARKMKIHGYDAIDFQAFVNTETGFFKLPEEDFKKSLTSKRAKIESEGIFVNQAHSPWRCPARDFEESDRQERLEAMKKAVRGTSYIGAKYLVVHPIMPFGENSSDYPEQMREMNVEFFTKLCEYAKEYGVTVCLENMPFLNLPISSVQTVVSFVRELSISNLKVCYDVGHDLVWGGNPAQSVKEIGDLLACLHVHDNDGVYDLHLPPFKGVCNWEEFVKSLKESAYSGVFSLETQAKDGATQMATDKREYKLIKKVKELLDK